jgi:hypothetical protein
MSDESLLPQNATPWETALSLTSAQRRPVPWEVLRRLWDPLTTPVDVLPYLANGLSVDLWYDDFPDAKRRAVTARSHGLHRLKGKVEGVRQHVAIVDAELRRAITPPAKTFLMPPLTGEERMRYLALFAQVRIRPYVLRGTYRFAHFTSKAYGREKAFLNFSYLIGVNAWQRYRRSASLWDHGEEIELTTRHIVEERISQGTAYRFDEVILPRTAGSEIFLNAPPKWRLFFGRDPGAPERLIRVPQALPVNLTGARELYTTLLPDGDFIAQYPEKVAETHAAQAGSLFMGGFFVGAYLPQTISWRYLYDRFYLHDLDRVPELRKRSVHIGYTRLGMPGYWAEYKIAVRGQFHAREVSRFIDGFLRAPNREPLNRTIRAVRVSKAARDKALIDTMTKRDITVSDRITIQSNRHLGDLVEV